MRKTITLKEWKRLTSECMLQLDRLPSGRNRKPKLVSCPYSLLNATEYVTGLCVWDQPSFCKDSPLATPKQIQFSLNVAERAGHATAAPLLPCHLLLCPDHQLGTHKQIKKKAGCHQEDLMTY